jgi:ABC-type antimicrobial peptide transport system permease subunit
MRTHEIGVCMALSTQQGDGLGMVLGKGFMLIVAGVVLGLLASVGLTRYPTSRVWAYP